MFGCELASKLRIIFFVFFFKFSGVGKTSLVSKYISNAFTKETGPTIGASFFTCKINLNDFKIKMQVNF